MTIRFGPAGLGGRKEAIGNLQEFKKKGISACEIAFTYSVYLRPEDARPIGKEAKKLNIKLSIHAPYWINLNSVEKKKIEQSKKRILDSCEIGHILGAYRIVFHPGYYGKSDKEETFQNIKKAIQEIQAEIRKNKWKTKLAPETTGKKNVFGSVDEILRLVNETRCAFCIDFAHVLAREKKINYSGILKKFGKHKQLHLHFSGIEFNDKGEKRHKVTPTNKLRELIRNLPRNKDIVVINESPSPLEDSVKGILIYNET